MISVIGYFTDILRVISCPPIAYIFPKEWEVYYMQRGRVLNLSKLKFSNFFIQNKILLICLTVLLMGIFFGVFSLEKYQTLYNFTENIFNDFFALRNGAGFSKILLSSLFRYCLVLVLFLIFGTSFFGVVATPFLLCIFGVLCGNITAYLYSVYALKGIAFNAIIFLPSVIVFAIVLLLVCNQTVSFSLRISSLTFTNTATHNFSLEFKKFLIMFLLFLGLCFVCAVIDAIISCSFIKYFDF